jgi:putative endonuclease
LNAPTLRRGFGFYKHMFWKNKNLTFGEAGEKISAKYLEKKGYKILEFNFCNLKGRRLGEIDIIAKDGDCLVFVEVKTRKIETFGKKLPEESIGRQKLHKLNKIAQFYLRQKKLLDKNWRFDAVSVWLSLDQKEAKVKHLESIFL